MNLNVKMRKLANEMLTNHLQLEAELRARWNELTEYQKESIQERLDEIEKIARYVAKNTHRSEEQLLGLHERVKELMRQGYRRILFQR
jgi:hypothetical protein